jgi:hypothetical protein
MDQITIALLPFSNRVTRKNPNVVRNRISQAFDTAIYERGMLHTLRLPLARWREVAETVLRMCPLSRVEFIDVPGCQLTVVQDGCDKWELRAFLDLPPSLGETTAAYREPVGMTRARGFPVREQLVSNAGVVTDILMMDLQASAGDRWPGPRLVGGLESAPNINELNALIESIDDGTDGAEDFNLEDS